MRLFLASLAMTLNQTTIDKPESEITFEDVLAAAEIQYDNDGPIDFIGLNLFSVLAAKHAFPTLTDKQLQVCVNRRCCAEYDLVHSMKANCDFAAKIITAQSSRETIFRFAP